MKRICRVLAGTLIAAATVVAMASPTFAAASPGAHSAVGQVAVQNSAAVQPFGPPQGCPYTDFCVYRDGGGGSLLVAAGGDCPDMCGHPNQDGAVYNNGDVQYNDVVSMNWGPNYTYAWTCIAQGSYWLYTSHYRFNHGTAPDGNYNVQNNVASSHWQHDNCGNSGG